MTIKVFGQTPSKPPLRETEVVASLTLTQESGSGVQADLADLHHGE